MDTRSTNETMLGVMPVLFVGHGNPMNAITDNEFSRGWEEAAKTIPTPTAILCISAHWEAKGTFVTAMEKPRTIHDFGGFPDELYEVEYPAPGSPALASEVQEGVRLTHVEPDQAWGLDHGTWSVARRFYPEANVPIVQMSLDYTKPPRWHYDLARELAPLRSKGVLILGSGNIVHNLRLVDWHATEGLAWAQEANEKMKRLASTGDDQALINYHSLGKEVQLAVPTPEHYLPLLYALALREKGDNTSFFNEKPDLGSIFMTSVRIGRS